MPTPNAGNPVGQRQLRVGVVGNVANGKIVFDERPGQRKVGEQHQESLSQRQRRGAAHPGRVAPLGSQARQKRLQCRQHTGQDQGEMAEFGNHQEIPTGACPASVKASATSGGI